MSLAHPGPGRCDVCGVRVPVRHPFLVQVKNGRALTNVVGAHCEGCDRHFQAFRIRRLQAIATIALSALLFAPLMAAVAPLAGSTAPVFALVITLALCAFALARAATWHDALRERIGPELLDVFARGLPDAPGTFGWNDVRFFPSLPRGLTLHHALEELRARATRTRELPN